MDKEKTSNELFNMFCDFADARLKAEGKEFIVNKDNKEIIRALVLYFTEHPEGSLNLNKGIYLMGTVGTGKTKLMSLLNAWPLNKRRFHEIRCKEIQRAFTINGMTELYQYGKNSYRMKHNIRCRERGYAISYMFDDFGEEKSSKSWGNEVLVMEDILQDRWVEFETTGMLTHITTNIQDGKLIQEIYGIRVRDRIRGMFNTIKLNGKSFRV